MIRAAFVLLAFAALAALDARPAAAEIYRPCIQGFVTCTFTSFEQCMMTVRATGDSCVQNPWDPGGGTGAANWDHRGGDKVPSESAASITSKTVATNSLPAGAKHSGAR